MRLFDADKSAPPLPVSLITGFLGSGKTTLLNRLLRVKGVLDLVGEPGPVAVHGVHHVFHPPVLLAGWPNGERRSAIVFITRGVSQAEVEAGMPGATA